MRKRLFFVVCTIFFIALNSHALFAQNVYVKTDEMLWEILNPLNLQFNQQTPCMVKVVKMGTGRSYGDVQVQVVSKVDSLQINNVSVNRGNCPAYTPFMYSAEYPGEYKFGQTLPLLTKCRNVLEVLVETNVGKFTFISNDNF